MRCWMTSTVLLLLLSIMAPFVSGCAMSCDPKGDPTPPPMYVDETLIPVYNADYFKPLIAEGIVKSVSKAVNGDVSVLIVGKYEIEKGKTVEVQWHCDMASDSKIPNKGDYVLISSTAGRKIKGTDSMSIVLTEARLEKTITAAGN